MQERFRDQYMPLFRKYVVVSNLEYVVILCHTCEVVWLEKQRQYKTKSWTKQIYYTGIPVKEVLRYAGK